MCGVTLGVRPYDPNASARVVSSVMSNTLRGFGVSSPAEQALVNAHAISRQRIRVLVVEALDEWDEGRTWDFMRPTKDCYYTVGGAREESDSTR